METDITAHPLRPRVEAATRAALDAGTLEPIETREQWVRDGEVAFRVRTVDALARKEAAGSSGGKPGPGRDPFLPPFEPGLHVGPVAPAHTGLLNKYPVLVDHLLVVTRETAPQDGALTREDCEALLRVLAAGGGLAFYNAGEAAGASQPHRHLQWVALDEPPPLAPRVAAGGPLPFACAREPLASAWLDDPAAGAAALHATCARLLWAIGRAPGHVVPPIPRPYNLLATCEQIWAVPRIRGASDGVPINALGYAGLMLAPDLDRAERVRACGPLALLADAAERLA